MGEAVLRMNPTKDELNWQMMRQGLERRRQRIATGEANIAIKKQDLNQKIEEERQKSLAEKADAIADKRLLRQRDNKHKYLCDVDQQQRYLAAKELNVFRKDYQSHEQGRDFDLYDRNRWKTEIPLNFQDPCVQGPSALINLAGYALMDPKIEPEKRRLQRSYLDLQIQEKEKLKEKEEEKQAKEKRAEVEIGNKAEKVHDYVEGMRKREAVDCLRANLAMVANRADKRQITKDTEVMNNQRDIYFCLEDSILTERLNKADRFHRTDWRGFTKEQRRDNFYDVDKQIEEKRHNRYMEAAAEKQRVQLIKESERFAKALDLRDFEKRLNLYKQLEQENVAAGKVARAQNLYLNKEVYGSNQPDKRFWDQLEQYGR